MSVSTLPRRRAVGLACALFAAAATRRKAQAAEAEVTIDNFSFTPESLTVAAGTRVVFTNRDDIPHTIVSDARPPLFKSKALDTDDAFAMVFDKPGTYGYFCSLHSHMQGTVVVT